VHRPVVGSLEARVQPGAELDHRAARVLGQEPADPSSSFVSSGMVPILSPGAQGRGLLVSDGGQPTPL
jgi:hypothetical protein